MADWSTLPYDNLGTIVLNFNHIEDCVRFCAVCHSFNHAYTLVKDHSQSRIMPWLFLAENTKENPECFRKLFSLGANKCYQLGLPETFGRRCWGSSYGWLVTVGLDLEMHLFNPLTKARILLPHQSTLPNHIQDYEWCRRCFVTRAVVLRIPDKFVVMLIYGEWSHVAFARLGDQEWTPIQCPSFDKVRQRAHDFCYWDGKILVIYRDGRLGYCDISNNTPCVRDLLPAPPSTQVLNFPRQRKLYLVNSNGELLIVIRYKNEIVNEDVTAYEDENICYETIYIVAFRPNFDTKEWKENNAVGDVALFVGDGHSTAFNVLNSCYCVRNRIYFTDDEMEFWNLPKERGGHDMGALDIGDEDMDIIPFYEGSDFRSNLCTPLWFTPMI